MLQPNQPHKAQFLQALGTLRHNEANARSSGRRLSNVKGPDVREPASFLEFLEPFDRL